LSKIFPATADSFFLTGFLFVRDTSAQGIFFSQFLFGRSAEFFNSDFPDRHLVRVLFLAGYFSRAARLTSSLPLVVHSLSESCRWRPVSCAA
jgi:hypothetical protein